MKNQPKKLLITTGIIFVVIVAIAGVAIRRHKTEQTQSTIQYDTFQAKRMDLSEKIDATGDVITEKNGSLYSPYSATVNQILVKPGEAVHKGEVLLILQIKDADVINYAAGYKSSLDQAKSNLLTAQNALARQQALYKVQGTTIDDLENAQKAVRQYQAQVSEFTLKLGSLSKNGVDKDNNILITAPYDAEVSWINVKQAQSVSTTDELLTLGGASAIRVEAAVDQGDISQIREGQKALITANDENRSIVPGVVTSFGSTGTTSSSVVTFPVDIKPLGTDGSGVRPLRTDGSDIKPLGTDGSGIKPLGTDGSDVGSDGNPNHRKNFNLKNRPSFRNNSTGRPMGQHTDGTRSNPPVQNIGKLLKSGMTVDVSIMVNAHPNVLAIPLRAVTQINGQSVVKVIKQGKYVAKKVQLGFTSEKYVEVLSGLSEGDEIAVPKTQFKNNESNNTRTGGRIRMGGMPPM
jgi:HlyD family secretion protein